MAQNMHIKHLHSIRKQIHINIHTYKYICTDICTKSNQSNQNHVFLHTTKTHKHPFNSLWTHTITISTGWNTVTKTVNVEESHEATLSAGTHTNTNTQTHIHNSVCSLKYIQTHTQLSYNFFFDTIHKTHKKYYIFLKILFFSGVKPKNYQS